MEAEAGSDDGRRKATEEGPGRRGQDANSPSADRAQSDRVTTAGCRRAAIILSYALTSMIDRLSPIADSPADVHDNEAPTHA